MTVSVARSLMARYKRAVTPVPTETEKLAAACMSFERAAKQAIKMAEVTAQTPEQKKMVDEMLMATEKFRVTFSVPLPDVPIIRLTPEQITTLLANPRNDTSWMKNCEAAMRADAAIIAREEKRLTDLAREEMKRPEGEAQAMKEHPEWFAPDYWHVIDDPEWGVQFASYPGPKNTDFTKPEDLQKFMVKNCPWIRKRAAKKLGISESSLMEKYGVTPEPVSPEPVIVDSLSDEQTERGDVPQHDFHVNAYWFIKGFEGDPWETAEAAEEKFGLDGDSVRACLEAWDAEDGMWRGVHLAA